MLNVFKQWVMWLIGGFLVSRESGKRNDESKSKPGAVVRDGQWKTVRVFFENGSYVVMSRRREQVGDLIGIAADALRVVETKGVGRILEITVDVDARWTLEALGPHVKRSDVQGYLVETVEVALADEAVPALSMERLAA